MKKATGPALLRGSAIIGLTRRLDAAARVAGAPEAAWELPQAGLIDVRAHFDGPHGIIALNAWRSALGRAAHVQSRRTATGVEWALTVCQDGITAVLTAHTLHRQPAASTTTRTVVAA